VWPGVAHHITQRGVNRQDVFFSQHDREVYLDLVKQNLADTQVRVLAYCLMTNHVHWLVIPERADSLALLFRRVHGRYAQYLNARRRRTGHLWQNRFFSCAVSGDHHVTVARYVEGNPVRAGLVDSAEEYTWSSARAHLAGPDSESIALLDWDYWTNCGGAAWWKQWICGGEDTRDVVAVRRATFAGRPLGPSQFLEEAEAKFGRRWRPVGRAKKSVKTEKGTERSASVASGA
jgi:putative transposase